MAIQHKEAKVIVQDGFVQGDTLVSFFNKLNDVKLGDSSYDMMKWDLDSEGELIVKSYHLKLLHLNYPSLQTLFEPSLASSFGSLWSIYRFLFLFGKHHMGYFDL